MKGVGFTGAVSCLFADSLGIGIVASYNPVSTLKVSINNQSAECSVEDCSMTHLVFGLKTVENYGSLALDATLGIAYGIENLQSEKATVIGLESDIAIAYPIWDTLNLRAGVTAIRYFKENYDGELNSVNLTHLAPYVGVAYRF